jgi:hypothetical protein
VKKTAWLATAVCLMACGTNDRGESFVTGIPDSVPSSTGDDSSGGSPVPMRLDVGAGDSGEPPCADGQVCDTCEVQEHMPCDEATTDLSNAIGLGCPGEAPVIVSTRGSPQAMGVRSSFGTAGTWTPREGTAFAVLGSGSVGDLDLEAPPGDPNDEPTHCNADLGPEYDVGQALPAPIRANDVAGDCLDDHGLLGTGDCSNTIQGQFNQGSGGYDYTELRIEAVVPSTANSVGYDIAFFSTEYPEFYGEEFNDLFVGWLESESWTGNISFDQQGSPLSLNAGFLDFRDDNGTLPEFAGTCMKQHAGTKWLTSTAPVTPGETITLVLAIFDASDAYLDSYVFIDNLHWGCDGTGRPNTTPVE